MRIAKAEGTNEEFQPQKLVQSLERAGSPRDLAQHIEQEIERELYDGITTHEIYSSAFAHLRRERRPAAARYSLKRALIEFGPSGFPFEAYIADLFNAEGFKTEIDQIVRGACVEHEVDVIVHKEHATVYGEAKFHNAVGMKSDLKVALYVAARIDDIRAAGHADAEGLLVTNTKFTDKAIEYAECRRLELLSWDYPQNATLHDRIEKAKLYPITALTSLSKREKMALLSQRMVLCGDLARNTDLLSRIGVGGSKAQHIIEEAGALCPAV